MLDNDFASSPCDWGSYTESKSERLLVVKVCDTSDIGQRNSALNESRILQKLNCMYISRSVAFHEDTLLKKAYLVLEDAGSCNLAEFVHKMRANRGKLTGQRPLGEALVKSIMQQLFQAIEYLHRNRICHRDLKPDNILVT